jgi:hypothetical protein
MNLDGRCMFVSGTADCGVVDAQTRLWFIQKGTRVVASYSGGHIERGCLAGQIAGTQLSFRYLQRERTGELHGGRSECEVVTLADGRIRILEHFRWTTRSGSGTNVFDEVPVEHQVAESA